MGDPPVRQMRTTEVGGSESKSYSLTQVARMFRTSTNTIKMRALKGDLPYEVNAQGRFVFPRESLLVHLDELIKRNNRIG